MVVIDRRTLVRYFQKVAGRIINRRSRKRGESNAEEICVYQGESKHNDVVVVVVVVEKHVILRVLVHKTFRPCSNSIQHFLDFGLISAKHIYIVPMLVKDTMLMHCVIRHTFDAISAIDLYTFTAHKLECSHNIIQHLHVD